MNRTGVQEVKINITGSIKTDMQLDGAVKILLQLRKVWKDKGNYIGADNIRDALLSIGISTLDNKDGSYDYRINKHAFSDLFTPKGEIR